MGCCSSRPAGPSASFPAGSSTGLSPSSTYLATPPSPSLASQRASAPVPWRSSYSSRFTDPPLHQFINMPLQRHDWTSPKRWTQTALSRERADFFDTCVTGRTEIWSALRAALTVLWDPTLDHDAADENQSLATAQTILDAAGVVLPTGDLAQGAYDILGNLYSLPEHVVANPRNLARDDDTSLHTDRSDRAEQVIISHPANEDDDTRPPLSVDNDSAALLVESNAGRHHAVAHLRTSSLADSKGKTVLDDDQDTVWLVARLSEAVPDVRLRVGKRETVHRIGVRIGREAKLPAHKIVRLAYLGKLLREDGPLLTQGWQQGHVVNALVFYK